MPGRLLGSVLQFPAPISTTLGFYVDAEEIRNLAEPMESCLQAPPNHELMPPAKFPGPLMSKKIVAGRHR